MFITLVWHYTVITIYSNKKTVPQDPPPPLPLPQRPSSSLLEHTLVVSRYGSTSQPKHSAVLRRSITFLLLSRRWQQGMRIAFRGRGRRWGRSSRTRTLLNDGRLKWIKYPANFYICTNPNTNLIRLFLSNVKSVDAVGRQTPKSHNNLAINGTSETQSPSYFGSHCRRVGHHW